MKRTATTAPQATGGAQVNDNAENATMPRMLPAMSYRYASSGSNSTNVRPTPSAIMAITAATAINRVGRISQIGNPVICERPTKMRSSPDRSISTRKMSTNPIRNVSATGA